jgi:hypothetical protein
MGHGCEALATVGTLVHAPPGEGGVQGDFDHIVPVISPALNTQSGSHHAPDTKANVKFSGNMSVPDCQTDGQRHAKSGRPRRQQHRGDRPYTGTDGDTRGA